MRTLLISLTAAGLLGTGPLVAQATPDRAGTLQPGRDADARGVGFEGMARFHDQRGAWRDGGDKRCPTCRVYRGNVGAEPAVPGTGVPGPEAPAPAVPEPGAAVLFALGALAVRARAGRRSRVR